MVFLKRGFLLPGIMACLPAMTSTLATASEPIPISAQSLGELAIYPEYRAPATVVSDNDSRISAEVSARIIEIPVKVGETVDKGTVLVRLEQTDIQLAITREHATADALRARSALARFQLTRARSLSAKKVVSEELLKQRESELNALLAEQKGQEAALTIAQRRLEKTIIRAPFKAIVTARLGQVGELANEGAPLVQIVDADRLEVSAMLQTRLAETLPKAKKPELATAGRHYALTLRTIVSAFDPRARTREARLTFDRTATDGTTAAPDTAMPGNAGELVWRSPQPSIPAELVVRRKGKLGIFVVDGESARFVGLAGAEEGRPAPVPLETTTLIATQGRFRLQDGDKISLQQ
jgi:RND family efflux transporter MFP subunit